MTQAHAKTIEACIKEKKNSRKNVLERGAKQMQKQKFYGKRTRAETVHTHARKEIHVMGNGNQKLLQCLLLLQQLCI